MINRKLEIELAVTLVEFALIMTLVVILLLPFVWKFNQSAKNTLNDEVHILEQAQTLDTPP